MSQSEFYHTASADTRNCRRIHSHSSGQICKVYGWTEIQALRRADVIVAALNQNQWTAELLSVGAGHSGLLTIEKLRELESDYPEEFAYLTKSRGRICFYCIRPDRPNTIDFYETSTLDFYETGDTLPTIDIQNAGLFTYEEFLARVAERAEIEKSHINIYRRVYFWSPEYG